MPDARSTYFTEAFRRNLGLVSPTEQALLHRSCVAVAGLGGVGGHHLMTLTRMGVGRFHLADYDVFEPANINRQAGAAVATFGRPKLEVMVEQALAVNPYLEIQAFPEGLTESNLDAFLSGAHVVLDGLDFFNFPMRRLLFNRARKRGLYVVTAGPLGFSAAVLVFSPYEGMGFDEYFHILDDLSEEDRLLHFAMGLAPRPTHLRYMDTSRVSFREKAGPSIASACMLCAGAAATETLKILLGRGPVRAVPHYIQIDPYTWTFRKGRLRGGQRNPVQRLKTAFVKHVLLEERFEAPCAESPKARSPSLEGHSPSVSSDTEPKRFTGAFGVRSILRRLVCRPVPSGSPLADCRPRPPKPSPPGPTGELLSEPVLHYLLDAGVQAPSGDNAQPWVFSATGDTLRVFIDQDRDRSFFNVDQIASIISAGAVAENIRIAASSLGLFTDVRPFPDPDSPTLTAALRFQRAPVPEDPLVEVLWKRCTNRKLYDPVPLSPVIREELERALTDFPDARLQWIVGRDGLRKLARIVFQADRIRLEDRRLHEHLHRMIRYSTEEALAARDGFPLKNLEAGRAGEVFLRLTRPWSVMNVLNRLGMSRIVAAHTARSVRHAAASALLTVSGTAPAHYFQGGRALQRVWLTATAQGLSLQPMAAVTLFWTRYQREGFQLFQDRHRKLLERVFAGYQALFAPVDFFTAAHVLLFRLGRASPIEQPTLRRQPEVWERGINRLESNRESNWTR